MKKNHLSLLAVTCAGVTISSCNTSKPNSSTNDNNNKVVSGMSVTPNPDAPITGLGNFIPMAQVYKTNGDYNNYVPVQVTDDGKELLSFPDPSDINADASPIQMANGFLLDRRGVSENTRFTSYTYTQYAALKQIPSPQELLNSIIPEARIIELVVLPITAQEAYADTAAVNNIIRSGFNNCKFLISTPAVEP